MAQDVSINSSHGPAGWAVIWPRIYPDDSEAVRRKKIGVRGLNGLLFGITFLFILVVCGQLAAQQSWPKLIAVTVGTSVYLMWALFGMVPVMKQILGPTNSEEMAQWPANAWKGTLLFLSVEILLAIGIMMAALPTNPGGVLRVLLFPILCHAVILLRWPGISAVAIICGGIYFWVFRGNGGGAIGFLIESTFSVVCMHMVVSTQKGKDAIEKMAVDLEAANRQLGAYAAQAEELAVARERNRVAREIHDSLGHYLTVVQVQLEAALAVHDREPGQAIEAVGKARKLVGEGLQEIRHSISALRAAPLENRTLCEALLALVAESEAGGLPIRLDVQGAERELSEAAGLTRMART